MTARAPSLVSVDAFVQLVREHMGLTEDFRWELEALQLGYARVRLEYSPTFVRPGGTVSGPTLFALADLALFAAVLSTVGLVPQAVTADLTIHFLRRPLPGAMVATCEILKVGKTLVHGDVRIAREDDPTAVCHATGTYALPPRA